MTPIDRVDDFAALDPQVVGPAGSDVGTGGMASKLEAARIADLQRRARRHRQRAPAGGAPRGRGRGAHRHVVPAVAATPREPQAVDRLRAACRRAASTSTPAPCGRWSSAARRCLPRASSTSHGEFAAGDAVDVVGPDRAVVARGLTTYSDGRRPPDPGPVDGGPGGGVRRRVHPRGHPPRFPRRGRVTAAMLGRCSDGGCRAGAASPC